MVATVVAPTQDRLFDLASLNTDERRGVVADTTLVPPVGLHPAVAAWFRARFPDGPTPAQQQAWPSIATGAHTLVAAPTGSGKTLAGFLMAINGLYLAHARGEPVTGTRVVYVSPLKALAVDIAENLERPLTEIAAAAKQLGLDAPDLTVGVRTGDTTSSERASMIRSPRTFVVTTPESLYLLVTAEKSRATLRDVETVLVDEIHALARDKRGAHLTLTLERLDHETAELARRHTVVLDDRVRQFQSSPANAHGVVFRVSGRGSESEPAPGLTGAPRRCRAAGAPSRSGA